MDPGDRPVPSTILNREQSRLVRSFKDDASLKPDVAIGFGAYIRASLMRRRQDGYPRGATRAKTPCPALPTSSPPVASLIAIAQPSVEKIFREHAGAHTKIVMTGNPVRRSVLEGDRARGRSALGVGEDETLLLVFGGSLGAHHLNERIVALKERLLSVPGLHVVHSTGADDFEATRDLLALTDEEAGRWTVQPYIQDMGDMLAAADLVLSRAGASSIAEIAALAVPSVLVPYPHATADHQTTNARFLVDAHAAVMFADGDIDGKAFEDALADLLASSSSAPR